MASSVVHSRAYLLIEQELLKFERNPVKGIRVYPTRAGNLFSLSAKIKGLPDTLWDGGVLKLRLRFSESYNYVPPEANFVTVPFHPNDKLRPFSPSGDDENPDASGGVRQPVEIEYDLDYLNRPPPKPQKPSQRKISFETYHADWSKLATSKTVDREPFNPGRHRRLKYGNSGQPKQKQQQKQLESNLERLDQMRRIYLAQRHASNVSTSRSLMSDIKKQPQPPHQRSQLHQFDNEEDEVEAEDLVQWTRDLPNDEAERIKA
uniref:UBIQUITIN_CONJUGAT_2 domain-containing protein n=1 Tax=Macrostomum lignano TaxID=282301 RepID=A0A1I8J8B1_9PLAT